jgi:hypothetical protein
LAIEAIFEGVGHCIVIERTVYGWVLKNFSYGTKHLRLHLALQ